MAEWQPIEMAPAEVYPHEPVDLWLSVHASPRSMGWADAFRVPDCWRQLVKGAGFTGPWVHNDGSAERELYADYITHFMRAPAPPSADITEGGDRG